MKPRILLADDFPPFTELVEGMLAAVFDVVGKVGNGEDLVAAAQELNPDVIIADISMPILSGIDAIRKLRQVGSGAKVMFLTVHSGADFVRICLELGAKAYVVKSQLDSDLLPALSAMLDDRIFVSDAV